MDTEMWKKQKSLLKKETIAIVILALLLVMAIGYIGIAKYQDIKEEKRTGLIQQGIQLGFQQGYEQAVVQVMQQAATCNAFPVRFQNQTLNLVAVECLQQMQAQQEAQQAALQQAQDDQPQSFIG